MYLFDFAVFQQPLWTHVDMMLIYVLMRVRLTGSLSSMARRRRGWGRGGVGGGMGVGMGQERGAVGGEW